MKYLQEERDGKHEGSVLSTQSVDSLDTKQTWKELRQELEEVGINRTVLMEKREFIVNLIQRAVKEGTMDQIAIPDGDSGFSLDFSTISTYVDGEFDRQTANVNTGLKGVGENIPQELSTIRQRRKKQSRSSSLESLLAKLFHSNMAILDAADAGDLEALFKLISKGLNINKTDRWNWTALHMAVYGGYTEMVRVLIEEGANLDARLLTMRRH
jgi:hypothetical protein